MNDNSHHLHHCLSQLEKLSQYLDRELDELTCQDIERHARKWMADDCVRNFHSTGKSVSKSGQTG